MRLKKSKKAQVESEDEDEAALDEVSEGEDESGSEEEFQPRKAKTRVQKTGKKKVKTPSQQPTYPQPSSQADLNTQFAGMAMGHSPSPGPAYQMSAPFVNPYPYYSPHSYGSPQVSPGIPMGYQLLHHRTVHRPKSRTLIAVMLRIPRSPTSATTSVRTTPRLLGAQEESLKSSD
ncbi:hypothetical protein CPB84DRAFT_720190 [Gymnopilus junonius]|uniref:Uncharacterized protein n=1 Tax=Gymnopilus junonius TaxID=109634 RepID=A0A9P5TNN9_GYMJU|nr:hypothetical protein CPB84DRAFT_720190 [Gymnopilus junonius]